MSLTTPATNEALATVLGKVPSGVFIATAFLDEKPVGMMASWVQQLSFEPPMVGVAVHPERALHTALGKSLALTLNVVPEGDPSLMRAFGRPSENPFESLETAEHASGLILKAALGALHLKVMQVVETGGDHHLALCQVEDATLLNAEQKPFVHIRKSGFHY